MKISDQGVVPMSPWGGLEILGMGGHVFMGVQPVYPWTIFFYLFGTYPLRFGISPKLYCFLYFEVPLKNNTHNIILKFLSTTGQSLQVERLWVS